MPEGCPYIIRKLFDDCTATVPDQRPTMDHVYKRLSAYLDETTPIESVLTDEGDVASSSIGASMSLSSVSLESTPYESTSQRPAAQATTTEELLKAEIERL